MGILYLVSHDIGLLCHVDPSCDPPDLEQRSKNLVGQLHACQEATWVGSMTEEPREPASDGVLPGSWPYSSTTAPRGVCVFCVSYRVRNGGLGDRNDGPRPISEGQPACKDLCGS